ncbi:MAG: hypothetical protein R3E03_05450 [Novosphingobium sp.]
MFQVAGTNGKGSTCAYLRAMLEAEGLTVHAATKPHLVRYNERIRGHRGPADRGRPVGRSAGGGTRRGEDLAPASSR